MLLDSERQARVELRLPFMATTAYPKNSSWIATQGAKNLLAKAGGCQCYKNPGVLEPANIGIVWGNHRVGVFYELFDDCGLVNSTGEGWFSDTYSDYVYSPFIRGTVMWTLVE